MHPRSRSGTRAGWAVLLRLRRPLARFQSRGSDAWTLIGASQSAALGPARIARVGSSSAASSAWRFFVWLSNSGRLAVVILVAAVFLILVIVGVPNADLVLHRPMPVGGIVWGDGSVVGGRATCDGGSRMFLGSVVGLTGVKIFTYWQNEGP